MEIFFLYIQDKKIQLETIFHFMDQLISQWKSFQKVSSHWGNNSIFVLKFDFAKQTCQLYLNFRAKNMPVYKFKRVKSIKYVNFRTKNQIQNYGRKNQIFHRF